MLKALGNQSLFMCEVFMISIIIRAEGSPQLLIETLNPLVYGVVQGLVGKLFIVTQPNQDEISRIVDEAGAMLIMADNWKTGLKQAAQNMKSDWVLLVDSGVIIQPSLWPCIERYIKLGNGDIAVSAPKQSFFSFLYNWRAKINLDQVVLIKTKPICNAVFGEIFGRRLDILPTHTLRLKL
jgi:hypothetical protein